MMKKLIPLLCFFLIVVSSCKKDSFNAAVQAANDDATIQAYIKANSLTDVVKDPSGLYYKVVTPGTGKYPDAAATVTVNSTGKLTDGTFFDTETALSIPLTNVIRGWQLGLPHINNGGRILLLIPSALGYGNTANGGIPKDSVLIFTVDMLSFVN